MKARTKFAVLGLDGVPFTLLEKLFEQGVMPRLAQTARSGAFLKMKTTQPPVSAVAWTSFMTGCNPGKHGIFGFTDLKPGAMSLRLPSFDDIKSRTIWQLLPTRRALVVNLPFTYPARPLNGVLISGFVAPIFERAVYPESLLPWLRSRNYKTDVDSIRGRTDRAFLMSDLFETTNIHMDVMTALMESQPWELFVGVVTGTDRLHHFFFDAAEDRDHPFHRDFLEYYRIIDRFFGRFEDLLGGSANLIVLSDHGFERLKTQVYLNHILKNLGYLTYACPRPGKIEDINPDCRGFAMDPNRVYLNSRDRFRNGIISPSEKEEVRSILARDLKALTLERAGVMDPDGSDSPGDKLFIEVLFKEEVYEGDYMHLAPDLVLRARPGYDLKATVGVQSPCFKDIFTGTHTDDDAFLIHSDANATARLTEPDITDVAGLVLGVLS